jgi:hypothetical protein
MDVSDWMLVRCSFLRIFPYISPKSFRSVLSKFDPEDCSHTEAEDLKHLDPVPPPTISLNLYLALVDADQVSVEDPLFTTIFIGIKSQASSISGMGISRDPWIWQNWEEWAFHAEAEYFRKPTYLSCQSAQPLNCLLPRLPGCALPPLSTLIDDPTIAEQDAFTLFIQLQMPNAPQIHPLKPGLQVVPSDLVEGFAASLDNKNTGDVRFVCLEYRNPQSELDVDEDTNGSVDPLTTESTATSIASDGLVYRKRTLYAHADILRARSEYFRDLLDFQEVTASVGPARPTQRLGTSSDRKIQTVHCNDTDFQTLYWTLRYIYQNDLDFARNGDVRKVVERSNATSDFRARRLIGGDGVMPLSDEWEWHTSSKSGGSSTSVSVVGANDTDDIRTMRSGISASSTGTSLGRAMQSSIHSLTDGRSRSISRNHVVQSTPVNNDTPGTSRTRPTGLPISRSNNPEARSAVRSNGRAAGTTSASRQGHRASSTISTPQAPSTEISPSSSRIYPLQYPSGAAVSSPVAIKIKDPHPHPTSPPPPASSFAIFSLAHRYRLLDLQQLAQGDLMERLTPGTACSLLLASFKYDELHLQAQEYVVENWTAIQEEVSRTLSKTMFWDSVLLTIGRMPF